MIRTTPWLTRPRGYYDFQHGEEPAICPQALEALGYPLRGKTEIRFRVSDVPHPGWQTAMFRMDMNDENRIHWVEVGSGAINGEIVFDWLDGWLKRHDAFTSYDWVQLWFKMQTPEGDVHVRNRRATACR